MMATLNVTDLPEETMSALTARAYAQGYPDRLSYVRAILNKLAQEPITRERFAYRVQGEKGRGILRRLGDDPRATGSTYKDFSEQEADAMRKAEDLIRRNQPGDIVKALGILDTAFQEVFEVPV